MSWTSPDDVLTAWIGGSKPSDPDQVQVWVDRAERLLRREVPDLTARVTSATPDADLLGSIRDVVAAMVTRVYRNPDGLRAVQQSDGSFSATNTYSGSEPGGLYVTASELAVLGSGSPAAFEVDTLPSRPEVSPLFGALVNGPDSWAPGQYQ